MTMALGRWLTSDWLPGAPPDSCRGLADGTPLMLRVSDGRRAQGLLRDVSGRVFAAQEDERRRIARELHDEVSMGADDFLLKRKARSEPLPAFHEVVHDCFYVAPTETAGLVDDSPKRQRRVGRRRLTPRQREIARFVASGHSTTTMASLLRISPQTVAPHNARILRDLNPEEHGRRDLVLVSARHSMTGTEDHTCTWPHQRFTGLFSRSNGDTF